MNAFLLSLVLAGTVQTNASEYKPTGPKIRVTMQNGRSFVITTDPKASPKTVAHILRLTRRGFYDRQQIHRVESWVTQWGAGESRKMPLYVKDKEGKQVVNPAIAGGGSGGKDLPFEMSHIDFNRGVVGVASTGLQKGGDSQLFILKADTQRLWHSYAVVGKVTQGMSVVDKIKRGDRIRSMRVEGSMARRRRR